MKRKFLTLFAVAFAMAVAAQEQTAPNYGDFTIDAQVRARGEYRGGQSSQDAENGRPELSVNDRVRLSFGWERKNISMKVAAQHTGLWQDGGQKNTMGNITLHEAWAKVDFGKGFFTQVGRQELSYDDERLLGSHDWAATGRAHDALRIGWDGAKHRVHTVVSFNQTAETTEGVGSDKKLYKNMQMLWYHFGRELSPFQISALFLNQGVSDANGKGVNYMQTFGTYASFEKKKLSANASFYYQRGYDRTGADVKAFMMSANLGWQFSRKVGITVGDDYLSGSDGLSEKNNTFNLLYGSYHEFLGSMDYFGYGAIPTYGINDFNIKASYDFSPKLDMRLGLHWLLTPNPIKDYLKNHEGYFIYPVSYLSSDQQEKIRNYYASDHRFMQNLGTELDLEASYRPWKDVTFQAGFSMMFTSETMQLLKGVGTSRFQKLAWVSFNLNPTIFSTRHRK